MKLKEKEINLVKIYGFFFNYTLSDYILFDPLTNMVVLCYTILMKIFKPTNQCFTCKGECCKRIPGNCTPKDILSLFPASTLKESVELALKTGNYSIDWYEADERLYYIRPATIFGIRKGYDPSWGGKCVFLNRHGCKLNEARPTGCKRLNPNTCHEKPKIHPKQAFGRLWRRYINLSSFEYLKII